MNIENKNLKFSGACTHNLTCRWLAKRGIKIVSERRQTVDATTRYCLTYIGMIYVYWMLYGLYFPL